MQNKGLVSIIITTYKRESTMVQRAINSILAQTYDNFELFIVDDSPNDFVDRDNVKNMVNSLGDDRIKYIEHEINKGACAARNTGIKASNGEYIAFLDDDDEWYDTKLEKQVQKMIESNCDFVYCKKLIHDKVAKKDKIEKHQLYRGNVFEKLLWSNFIGPTSVALIKKDCFDKVGIFNTKLLAAQDYEMWLRIAKEFKVDFVDEELLHYYIHEGDRISSDSSKKIQGIEMVNSIYAEYYENNKRLKAHKVSNLVPRYINNRDFTKAKTAYLQGLKIDPFYMLTKVKFNLKCLQSLCKIVIQR